jgi:hypothetical protein
MPALVEIYGSPTTSDTLSAVGGITRVLVSHFCRLDMKHPPTAVGGIPDFLCKAKRSQSKVIFGKLAHDAKSEERQAS